jgi:hypothetical protein
MDTFDLKKYLSNNPLTENTDMGGTQYLETISSAYLGFMQDEADNAPEGVDPYDYVSDNWNEIKNLARDYAYDEFKFDYEDDFSSEKELLLKFNELNDEAEDMAWDKFQ